jgi:hypothetical protein
MTIISSLWSSHASEARSTDVELTAGTYFVYLLLILVFFILLLRFFLWLLAILLLVLLHPSEARNREGVVEGGGFCASWTIFIISSTVWTE